MMSESRKVMQEDRLSQKYSITPCNALAPRCVLPPYLHSARQFTAGIYSSHRGLQRLRGRSSQQRGSAGHLLCRRGDMLSVTWGFTGPGHTWASHQLSPMSLSGSYPHPKFHCSMSKAGVPSKQNCIVKRAPNFQVEEAGESSRCRISGNVTRNRFGQFKMRISLLTQCGS